LLVLSSLRGPICGQQVAFEQLKAALILAPILGNGTFYLDTDASNIGLGAVLSDDQNGTEVVIA